MSFRNFFKRIIGVADEPAISTDPFHSRPAPATAAVAAAHGSAPEPRFVVQRDEILDGRSRIAGYRFVVRGLGSGMRSDAGAAVAALRADNVQLFAERRLALVPLTVQDWYSTTIGELIAANSTFLVASPAPADHAAWLQVLQEVKAAGAHVGLDAAAASDPAALALADFLLLDFGTYSLANFERLVKALSLSHPQLALAADGITSWPEHRLCQAMGIRYCLGGYAVNPDTEEKGDKVNQSRLVLIEMLNLLRRDVDAAEIAAVAKRDPWVALKIVSMANSPISGLSSPVANLEQAVLVLGRETLYRWLSISLFRAGADSERDLSLLELSLFRARFLELLADGRSKQESDELFLVGLLSLLDCLLAVPIEQIVVRMHLPGPVADVLLKSEGPHAPFLMLALSTAEGRAEQAARVAASLGIDLARLEQCSNAARVWTEEVLLAS
jgi:c-di-GMP phosphodiesterase